jgi:hypothetical protein
MRRDRRRRERLVDHRLGQRPLGRSLGVAASMQTRHLTPELLNKSIGRT